MELVSLQWGKPRIFLKDLGTIGAQWKEMVTPVQDSTNLTPTKGDKQEAPVEGGENEAVKYKKSTYQFLYNIRKAKGRKAPMPSSDGVVDHEYSVMLQPEDPTVNGIYIERTAASIDDSFTAGEGGIWAVTHDALKAENGNTVKHGVVSTVGNNITFVEDADLVAPGSSPVTITGTYEKNQSASTDPVYYMVVDKTGHNPKVEGWYELSGSTYVLSNDTEADNSKDYYVKA